MWLTMSETADGMGIVGGDFDLSESSVTYVFHHREA